MRVVIIGGGYAGVTAALRLAHNARRARIGVDITLINESDVLVERIRLHQAVSGQKLKKRLLPALLARVGVHLVVGRVTEIEPTGRTVRVGDRTLAWDRLVLALGSRVGRFDVPGSETFARTINADTAPRLAKELAELPRGSRVLLVGGGLTGVELATELGDRYPALKFVLLTRGRLLGGWSQTARTQALRALQARHVDLLESVAVQRIDARSIETDKGPMPYELCVWSAGFEMPALLKQAGLATNARGQALVDPQLRSISHKAIYVAGDVAAPVLDPGEAMPMGCKSAMPLGAHVGDNVVRDITGRSLAAFDYSLLFYCVSLGRTNGLVQLPAPDGGLMGKAFTGRPAALFKELICKATWWSIWLEAHGIPATIWRRTGHAPQTIEGNVLEAPVDGRVA